MLKSILGALALAAGSVAIDCTAKELSDYDFSSFKGVYSWTEEKESPPSKTKHEWHFGICEPISKKYDICPDNSDICGVTRVNLKGNEYVTEIIGFSSKIKKSYQSFIGEGADSQEKGIKIIYENANWGDNLINAELRFICSTEESEELNQFKVDSWDGINLKAHVKSKGACISSENDHKKKPSKHPNENSESWGWFTWIFIFMVLFLSIYIVGGAWFQYNKGNSIDFQSALKEVLDNFVELLKGLPAFVREIVEKVTGNSNRGEYSAV